MSAASSHSDAWEPPVIGPMAQVSLALVALDLPRVSRAALRALLPVGTTRPKPSAVRRGLKKKSINRTSNAFGAALKQMEDAGLIRRTEDYVEDIDRPGLAVFIAERWGAAPPIPWEYAAALVALVRGDDSEQQEVERDAIGRLMQQAPTRPGPARLVHRSHL